MQYSATLLVVARDVLLCTPFRQRHESRKDSVGSRSLRIGSPDDQAAAAAAAKLPTTLQQAPSGV
jgi:hypothetical protein